MLINNRRAHRMGDVDEHCGGRGKMVQGSPDVLIGDHVSTDEQKTHAPRIVLKDMPGQLGVPLINVDWQLLFDWNVIEEGVTDQKGQVHIRTPLRTSRIYELRYPGRTLEILLEPGTTADTLKGIQIRLSAIGYHPGPLTGRPSSATTNAIIAFQIDHGLAPDGRCEGETRALLQKLAGF
nr:peptidoglycan-binding protein [Polyangium jinanense]